MAKNAYPDFHKALLDESLYPSTRRRIKFQETRFSYTYRTGDHIYIVRKEGPTSPSPALKEVYSHEALTIGRRWAPQVYLDVVPIVRTGQGFALGGDGDVVDYALRLKQLSENFWLHRLIAQEKLGPPAIGRVARFLAERHHEPPGEEIPPEIGKPEHLRNLTEEVLYQVKKYVNVTVSPPVLDAVTRPMFKFIGDYKKLFLRRFKKGLVTDCHGALVPEHVYVKGREVCAVSPLTGSRKFRQLDVANDLATLLNELTRQGAGESTELFLKRYVSGSRDREVVTMLPAYRTLQAMRSGLACSESLAEEGLAEERRAEFARNAQAYFELAVQAAREIPR
jgi:aminoglycoside phosphotransferase family enzyme